jgi:hypothetical protein
MAKAHFDGKNIVLDEPVDWPAGTPLVVSFAPGSVLGRPAATEEERLAALQRLASYSKPGPPLPDEALTREGMYGDSER